MIRTERKFHSTTQYSLNFPLTSQFQNRFNQFVSYGGLNIDCSNIHITFNANGLSSFYVSISWKTKIQCRKLIFVSFFRIPVGPLQNVKDRDMCDVFKFEHCKLLFYLYNSVKGKQLTIFYMMFLIIMVIINNQKFQLIKTQVIQFFCANVQFSIFHNTHFRFPDFTCIRL